MAGSIKPLKILQVTEASSAGVGLHVINLVRLLASAGHEVHLIYSPRRIDKVFEEGLAQIPGLHAVPLEMPRNPHPLDFMAFRFIRKYAQANGPFDILHGHSSKGGALIRLASLALPGAKVYTPNAMVTTDPTLPHWKRLVYQGAEWILDKFTDVFIAVSEEEAAEALRIGIKKEKIVFIPNGIEPPNLPDRQAARDRLNLADDEIVIGFVGRLSPQKAPGMIIQAMNILIQKSQDHNITLIMVGDGELRKSLLEMVENLQIGTRVRWLGEARGIFQMPAFDLLAFPSFYEGMPYVLIEALFAGLPIVATRVGGASLMVESDVNGYLVPPGDPQRLAQALGELIADPNRRLAFGDASLKKSQLFKIDIMTSRIQALYETLKV